MGRRIDQHDPLIAQRQRGQQRVIRRGAGQQVGRQDVRQPVRRGQRRPQGGGGQRAFGCPAAKSARAFGNADAHQSQFARQRRPFGLVVIGQIARDPIAQRDLVVVER